MGDTLQEPDGAAGGSPAPILKAWSELKRGDVVRIGGDWCVLRGRFRKNWCDETYVYRLVLVVTLEGFKYARAPAGKDKRIVEALYPFRDSYKKSKRFEVLRSVQEARKRILAEAM